MTHPFARRQDFTQEGTTGNERHSPVAVQGISTAVRVATGSEHTCALLSDHSLACWGNDLEGQLGDGNQNLGHGAPAPVPGITDATYVAAGLINTCIIRSDTSVVCWGSQPLGNGVASGSSGPVAVTGLTGATALAGGDGNLCAYLAGGGVSCWGSNISGALGDGTTTDRLTPVAVQF